MAPGKEAADFNAIINAGRQRKKNETLANQIFGNKNRRTSAPGAGAGNRKAAAPSLASRITNSTNGISKRTVSNFKPAQNPARSNGPAVTEASAGTGAGNLNAVWTHDLHSSNTQSGLRPSARASRPLRGDRGDRLYSAIHGSASSPALHSQFNVVQTPSRAPAISIRGMAGPYIVIAKNFAPGTTAADIESATTPVGGITLSCRIISQSPNVMAELIFETKEGADNVVDTFNNQNADGNLLHVFHKIGGPAPKIPQASSPAAPRALTPQGPRAGTGRSGDSRGGYGGGSDRYVPRSRSRERTRRDYESRAEVVDGSYGFDERMDTDNHDDRSGGLYSDNLAPSRGRGRGNSRERGGRNDRGSRSYY